MAAVGTDVEIMLKDIGMIYKSNTNTDLVALTNVTMNIYKGEFISLLGPSGCGKTTLLRIIADLLTPSVGEITVGGKTPREARLKRKYGIVFQGAVLYEWRTVKKNVMLPLEIMHLPKRTAKSAPRKCSSWSDSRISRSITRDNCQAVCSSGWV